MLGIFALLTQLVAIIAISFLSVGAIGQAAVRWLMLGSVWIYAATAVINVMASVLMIGAPPRMKVIVVGLCYAVLTFLACVFSWLTLLGGPFASGFLGYAILLIQYPAWLMYIARTAEYAESPQAKDLLKSAIGFACIGLTLWIGVIIQGAVMAHVSTWAASMGRMIEGSTLAHLLLIQGHEYQVILWAIPIALTVLACVLLMWVARFTQGVPRHVLKSVVTGIVLVALTVLVEAVRIQISVSSPFYLLVLLALPAFMVAAVVLIALAPIRAFRASLLTLRALEGVAGDGQTEPESSAPEQPVALYKRRPVVLGLSLMVGVAGIVLLVYGLGRTSGDWPRQYPLAIPEFRGADRSSNSNTPGRPVPQRNVGMPAADLNVVAQQLNNKIWQQVVSSVSLPSADEVKRLAQLSATLNRGIYFNTLGVAHYRMGNYQAAIEACLKSLELTPKEKHLPGPYAGDLAFLAMSHFQLGDRQEADKYRHQLSESMKLVTYKEDKECIGFREEVDALFDSPGGLRQGSQQQLPQSN
jgi:Tetratricopeptide repeat